MKIPKQVLFDALSSIEGTPILVLGDLMLDRYVWGRVDRISPEAPVPVVLVNKTEDRLGGAGNVVNNLCKLGAKVSLAGFVGSDIEGRIVQKLLARKGVVGDGIIIDPAVKTTLKTRVIAQSQQVVRVDREESVSHQESLYHKLASWLELNISQHKAVIVSDYGKGTIAAPVMAALEQTGQKFKSGQARSPVVLDPHPRNYGIYANINVAKPNRREAEIATGLKIRTREQALSAARVLADKWGAQIALVTLGEDGMVLTAPEISGGLFLDTVAVEVFDVSGAGDTVTALFAAALAAGISSEIAGVLANLAAGVVVAEVGTAAIDPDKLRLAIERQE